MTNADCALSAAMANGLDAPEVRCNLAFTRCMGRRYSQALEENRSEDAKQHIEEAPRRDPKQHLSSGTGGKQGGVHG